VGNEGEPEQTGKDEGGGPEGIGWDGKGKGGERGRTKSVGEKKWEGTRAGARTEIEGGEGQEA